MKRSKFTDEQILAIVKERKAGRKVADLSRTHRITEQTYYPLEGEVWRDGAFTRECLAVEVDRSLPGL
jgi:Transposase